MDIGNYSFIKMKRKILDFVDLKMHILFPALFSFFVYRVSLRKHLNLLFRNSAQLKLGTKYILIYALL